MKKVGHIIFILGFIFAGPAFGGGLQIIPNDITLTGPQAGQRLIVLIEEGGQYIGDRTSQATFTSSNPAVATINEAGFVEDTIAAIAGRTIHTYHTEGAGGGHAPDIIRLCGERNVLPSPTNPTMPLKRSSGPE